MTRDEIISGLKFTIEMFLFDPSTGETCTEPRNDMDKITIDACMGAIELLKQEPKTRDDDISEYEHDHAVIKAYHDGQAFILDKIRAEIIDKSYLSYDNNPRHIIDESWVLEIIDKYRQEG